MTDPRPLEGSVPAGGEASSVRGDASSVRGELVEPRSPDALRRAQGEREGEDALRPARGGPGGDDFAARHVPFEACFNFRDIGGYEAAEGRRVRWGRYFRSGALHDMTVADAERATGLGVASVLDLRRSDEFGSVLGPLVDAHGARHYHVPILPEGSSELLDERHGRGISGSRYVGYLEFGAPRFVDALRLLGDAASYPTVVHCSAGKDRTGTLTAIVLELLGVDRATIVADYALTNVDVDRGLDWMIANGRIGEARIAAAGGLDQLRKFLGVPVEAIEVFLDHLAAEYGGAAGFARAHGLADADIEALRANLLEDRA